MAHKPLQVRPCFLLHGPPPSKSANTTTDVPRKSLGTPCFLTHRGLERIKGIQFTNRTFRAESFYVTLSCRTNPQGKWWNWNGIQSRESGSVQKKE
ncbi:hypothetical protein TNIN_264421 [Trichonephila inaurata madagascariensis]|uniref:Uncharacterized protein n=1 Tax=Trichonephila inaurata madagascariensis TaxID=2747483 RepID=A0A8X6JKI4_9ARAC|nr:hypothetical protein TNIN_264421 [Trichonephila inaurata madagascariensis]